MHVHITNSSERIPWNGGKRDEEGSSGLGAGDEAEKLLGGAGFAEEDEDVAGGEGADVAVEGVEGERKEERKLREMSVWEILLATKADLPTPVKKTVPVVERRTREKSRVWERSRCLKKWLRRSCWDLKRARRLSLEMSP